MCSEEKAKMKQDPSDTSKESAAYSSRTRWAGRRTAWRVPRSARRQTRRRAFRRTGRRRETGCCPRDRTPRERTLATRAESRRPSASQREHRCMSTACNTWNRMYSYAMCERQEDLRFVFDDIFLRIGVREVAPCGRRGGVRHQKQLERGHKEHTVRNERRLARNAPHFLQRCPVHYSDRLVLQCIK